MNDSNISVSVVTGSVVIETQEWSNEDNHDNKLNTLNYSKRIEMCEWVNDIRNIRRVMSKQ